MHSAPAHGPDDFKVALRHDLSLVSNSHSLCTRVVLIKYLAIFFLQECHVDEAGCYTDDVGKRFAGLNVLTEANDKGF